MTDQPDVLSDDQAIKIDNAQSFVADWRYENNSSPVTESAFGVALTHMENMLAEVYRLREMVRRLQEENERIKQHDYSGWHGLANIYKIIRGKPCKDFVSLGMATSAVVEQLQQFISLQSELTRLTSALDEANGLRMKKEWRCDNLQNEGWCTHKSCPEKEKHDWPMARWIAQAMEERLKKEVALR